MSYGKITRVKIQRRKPVATALSRPLDAAARQHVLDLGLTNDEARCLVDWLRWPSGDVSPDVTHVAPPLVGSMHAHVPASVLFRLAVEYADREWVGPELKAALDRVCAQPEKTVEAVLRAAQHVWVAMRHRPYSELDARLIEAGFLPPSSPATDSPD